MIKKQYPKTVHNTEKCIGGQHTHFQSLTHIIQLFYDPTLARQWKNNSQFLNIK